MFGRLPGVCVAPLEQEGGSCGKIPCAPTRAHSLIHSVILTLTRSLVEPPTCLLTHSLAYSLMHARTHPTTHSSTQPVSHPPNNQLTLLPTHPTTNLLTHSPTHPLTHSPTHSRPRKQASAHAHMYVHMYVCIYIHHIYSLRWPSCLRFPLPSFLFYSYFLLPLNSFLLILVHITVPHSSKFYYSGDIIDSEVHKSRPHIPVDAGRRAPPRRGA